MNHVHNEITYMLLNDDENNTESNAIEDCHARNERDSVKMTGCLVTFAILVTFVYGVQMSFSDDAAGSYFVPFEEKTKIVNDTNPIWTYDCTSNTCIRRPLNDEEIPTTLGECNMICGMPSLWPKPRSVKVINKKLSTFRKSQITTKIVSPKSVEEDTKKALDIFMMSLPSTGRIQMENADLKYVFINIKVTSHETKLHTTSDESYKLNITKIDNHALANIAAKTYFGARHALETLSQLILFDDVTKKLQIYHDIEIQDSPAFSHRGLMVDTARNFFPIEQLMSIVDGMAMNKLNVFHLHLTDAVSFPIVLPSNPWLAKYGAYGPGMVYTPEDIKGLIEYARVRGVRVILEVDAPSHVNAGWNHLNSDKEKIVICGDTDVFNGHLNPDSKKAQQLLETVYADLLELGTDRETFHIGGDEVNLRCLERTNASSKYTDIYDFWADYMNNIFAKVGRAFHGNVPNNLVIWSSDLTDKNLGSLIYSKNLVVQYWFGQLDAILRNGNNIIFSTVGKWYLDCGFGSWKASGTNGVCDPYTPWQTFYNYRPWQSYTSFKNQVLGGEACLWTEEVGEDTLETRIWPRTAALAERLWSDLPKIDIIDVSTRLSDQRQRLISRGLKVATIWPKWCSLNPGKCL